LVPLCPERYLSDRDFGYAQEVEGKKGVWCEGDQADQRQRKRERL